MKWRDVFIGAISSLAVTVLGGMVVFYATKEPDERKNEKLVYVLNQTASFTGGAQDIAFSVLSITNEGGASAKRVSINIDVTSSEIRDLAISSGSGLREVSRERTPKMIRIVYEALLPKESVIISMLLSNPEKPNIDIRSDAALAEERPTSSFERDVKKSRLNELAKVFVPISGMVTGILFLAALFYIRHRGLLDLLPSRNDTGFLLLHNGLIAEAEAVLGEAIRDGRCDQYTLSNYALCKAATGKLDEAQGLLRAAAFRNRTGHGKAVVMFNDGIINLISGNKEKALHLLKEAITLSPLHIKNYCHKSVYLDGVRAEPTFLELFKNS